MKTAKILTIAALATAGAIALIKLNGAQPEDDPQWTAEYFNNTTLTGEPIYTELIDNPTKYFGSTSPAPGVIVPMWSARFTKKIYFEKGYCTVELTNDNGGRFYLDDEMLIDNWTGSQYATKFAANFQITEAGLRTCTIEHFNNSGPSNLTYNLIRTEKVTIPPGSTNVVEDSNFTLGHWKTFGCNEPLNIINIDGKPTLHFDAKNPEDNCWLETWHSSIYFPIVHPGDKIIITCKVRTGPESDPPIDPTQHHAWAGIVMDVREQGTSGLTQIGELSPARIISKNWIEQTWEVTIPIIQKKSWDQKYSQKGIPEKCHLRKNGQGRNTSYENHYMPQNMIVSLDCDLGSYNTVEWAEYQDVKAYIIPYGTHHNPAQFPPHPNMIENPYFTDGSTALWGFHTDGTKYWDVLTDADGQSFIRLRPRWSENVTEPNDSACWTAPFLNGAKQTLNPGDKIIFQFDARCGPRIPDYRPTEKLGAGAGIDIRTPNTGSGLYNDIFYTLNIGQILKNEWSTIKVETIMPNTIDSLRHAVPLTTTNETPSQHDISYRSWPTGNFPTSMVGQPFPTNCRIAPWIYNWRGGVEYADFKNIYFTILKAGTF